jgi:hypothetical protein
MASRKVTELENPPDAAATAAVPGAVTFSATVSSYMKVKDVGPREVPGQ